MLGQLGEDDKVSDLSLQVGVRRENKGCVSAQGTLAAVLGLTTLWAFN